MICFERSIAKLLKAIISRRLEYLDKRDKILSTQHFGGRKKRSAAQAMGCFIDEIHRQFPTYVAIRSHST
jgi:hypothetical protein